MEQVEVVEQVQSVEQGLEHKVEMEEMGVISAIDSNYYGGGEVDLFTLILAQQVLEELEAVEQEDKVEQEQVELLIQAVVVVVLKEILQQEVMEVQE